MDSVFCRIPLSLQNTPFPASRVFGYSASIVKAAIRYGSWSMVPYGQKKVKTKDQGLICILEWYPAKIPENRIQYTEDKLFFYDWSVVDDTIEK